MLQRLLWGTQLLTSEGQEGFPCIPRWLHASMVPQHLLNMMITWMNGMLPSITMNKDVPSTVNLKGVLLAPEVELGFIQQPTSGGVSLWEFWLLESGVQEGKSHMQGRR